MTTSQWRAKTDNNYIIRWFLFKDDQKRSIGKKMMTKGEARLGVNDLDGC